MGFWRRSLSDDRGNTLTEFAGVCLVYVVLTTSFVDMNFMIGERAEMAESARAAARVAASFVPANDSLTPEGDICEAARNIAITSLTYAKLNPSNYDIEIGPAAFRWLDSTRAIRVKITKTGTTRLLPGPLFSDFAGGASSTSTFMFEYGQSLSEDCLAAGKVG